MDRTLTPRRTRAAALLGPALAVALLAGCGSEADPVARPPEQVGFTADEVPVLVPGRPGEEAEVLSPGESGQIPNSLYYVDADVEFVSDMVPHHLQALEMAELAPGRAGDERVLRLAERIAAAQQPEVGSMTAWLEQNGLPVPDAEDHGAHAGMPGMASQEELFALAQSQGEDFDRLFLQLMTRHHEGARSMAQAADLEARSAYVLGLAADVNAEQGVEIGRMQDVLADL